MKHGFTMVLTLLSVLLLSAAAWGQTTLVDWTFESLASTLSVTGTAPTLTTTVADAGALTTGSAVSAYHATSATTWSSPAGNGSARSLSSNNWSVGDYYQFAFSTTGYSSLVLTWDQMGSNTGPKDFKVQYSTDGLVFTDVYTYTVINGSWSSTTAVTTTSYTLDLTSVTVLNNAAKVYVRLVDNSTTSISNSTVATGGTGRVDNFVVKADVALPVELSSFTASGTKSGAVLTWKTSTEKNNYGFNVQRRAIGSDAWSTIAFVSGSGTSNVEHTYSYSDANVAAGTYAYRIAQVDNDGTMKTYSESQVTVGAAAKVMTLSNYPNPFNPTTTFEFSVPNDGMTTVKIYNVLGQEVMTAFAGDVKAGTYQHATFDGSKFSSGIYFYSIENGGQKMVKRMMMLK